MLATEQEAVLALRGLPDNGSARLFGVAAATALVAQPENRPEIPRFRKTKPMTVIAGETPPYSNEHKNATRSAIGNTLTTLPRIRNRF